MLDIWRFIAISNPNAADGVIDRISQRIDELANFPEMGPQRRDLAEIARALTIGNYLALYTYDDASITIMRVIHGARDLPKLI